MKALTVKLILLSMLLISKGTVCFAKAIVYDGRDGLSSNSITKIAKDNRGLMWIGTYNGLNIYDGYTFTKISGPLSTLSINTLELNPAKNEILAGTDFGLYSVDLSTYKATRYSFPEDKSLNKFKQQIHALCILPSGAVYASIGKGIIAELKKGNALNIFCRLADTTKVINAMVGGSDRNLLVSNGDVYSISINDRQYKLLPVFKSLAPYVSISGYQNKLLLNGYHSRFSLFDIHTYRDLLPESLKKNNIPFPVLQSALKDNQLYLLCANYSFFITDLNTGVVNEVSKKHPDIFEGKNYQSIYVDENNIIWIGTNKGLIKIEERPELFTRSLYNFPARVSTRTIIEDPAEGIFIASYVGLWNKKEHQPEWTKFDHNTEQSKKQVLDAFKGSVQPLALLAKPGSSYIYTGSESEQLLRFDVKRKVYENINYTILNTEEQIKSIFTIAEDGNGTIWLGCGNGLASYDPEENTVNLHRKDAFDVGNCRVRYIYCKGNHIYVATVNGLYQVDIVKGIRKRYHTASHPALSNNDVLFVDSDEDNNLWLGTNGGGVNIISADGKLVKQIRKQNGLSNEVVYCIIPQDKNTLWISTFNGLDRYRKDLHSFNNFFEEDGLSSNEFNQNSFLKAADGKMYFGSINGVTSFYPQDFSPPDSFHIFLSGISKWDDKSQSVQLSRNNTNTNEPIIKKPSDLLLELHFGITDYSDPVRNIYSYRIKQLSDNWISLEDRHTLNLGGIPNGNYTVEVKAINSRGASSSNILSFTVKVVLPFYKTIWFYLLLLLCIGALFYLAYWLKYQNFKNVLQLRMRIASNLHDEVGSLLTRITMFSENLRYSKNSEEQKNEKLDKIALLSRDAVMSMSDVLWAIDSRNDFAGNLLDRMREHAEDMLLPFGIDVNFEVSETDLKQPISSDIRGEVYLIFKEAINNIAKHSKADQVKITYSIQDKNFLLRICNNGAEDQAGKFSTGQGLSNMEMRAKKIAAQITVTRKDQQFEIEIKN